MLDLFQKNWRSIAIFGSLSRSYFSERKDLSPHAVRWMDLDSTSTISICFFNFQKSKHGIRLLMGF